MKPKSDGRGLGVGVARDLEGVGIAVRAEGGRGKVVSSCWSCVGIAIWRVLGCCTVGLK
jgi:hypothetical protein